MPHRKHSPGKAAEIRSGWWRSSLLGIYEKLTCNDAVQPVDLIFVMAGQMERKQYGLELFRAGVAPRLVLSIGRFEVSKMWNLNVDGIDDLIKLREQTSPGERHFFMKVDGSGVCIEKAGLPIWNTYGEALALRQFLEKEKARRVIVISTDVHLRRVALALGKVFRSKSVEFFYCPIPSRLMSSRKENWWTRPDDRRFVLREMIKLAGYGLILSLPSRLACWIMRLHDGNHSID
jgi:hypothetical protein